jgi:ribosomal protein S19
MLLNPLPGEQNRKEAEKRSLGKMVDANISESRRSIGTFGRQQRLLPTFGVGQESIGIYGGEEHVGNSQRVGGR